jgi:hypothetical protein
MLTIYYLTGMGGRLHKGLGEAFLERGLKVQGRELVGEFKSLDFKDQIDLVASDIQAGFSAPDSWIVANSFGAYLFLHAQLQLPPVVGRVMLLSPIVGEFANEGARVNYIPPRARRLAEVAEKGEFPVPLNCQIHVGEHDWQSNPKNVLALGTKLGIKVHVVTNAGHMLPKDYVSTALTGWFGGALA